MLKVTNIVMNRFLRNFWILGARSPLFSKITENEYRKKSKTPKMTLFWPDIVFYLGRKLNSWLQTFRNCSPHGLLRFPVFKFSKKKIYTLLFWWIYLKIWAKIGHIAKMTSFGLPEKCYISAPRRNWLTGPSLDRSPWSCKALYHVSARANLMRSLCNDTN